MNKFANASSLLLIMVLGASCLLPSEAQGLRDAIRRRASGQDRAILGGAKLESLQTSGAGISNVNTEVGVSPGLGQRPIGRFRGVGAVNEGAAAGRFRGIGSVNAGAAAGRFRGVGANGGTAEGAGMAVGKRGVGGVEKTGMSLRGAGGSTYNGSSKGGYNESTGRGARSASHQFHDARNGKNYGDTKQTTYSNGKGTSQVDTDNHGNFTRTMGKGQKPTSSRTRR